MCCPTVEVSRRPDGRDDPLLSVHEASPGAAAASAQAKLVGTDCPTVYTPPEAGETIDALGAAGVKAIVTIPLPVFVSTGEEALLSSEPPP
jgi:hypothetical protein